MAKKWYQNKRSTVVLVNHNSESYCQYHNTKVVTWTKTHIYLDNGSWDTTTTRDRMNEVAREYGLGFTVLRNKGQTFVMTLTGHICVNKNAKLQPMDESKHTTVTISRRKRKPKHCSACALTYLAKLD